MLTGPVLLRRRRAVLEKAMETRKEQKLPRLLRVEKNFLLCVKEPGQECEKELPALFAAALGGEAGDYYCVHRLDRAVGGVMVYARTAKAAAGLSAQIQERRFTKEYLAVAGGVPEPQEGLMQDYLYTDKAKGRAFPVKRLRKGVKEAELAYRTLATAEINGSPAALVRVKLHTGRFHQIRCQFAARKMPLLGDGKYGSREKGCGVALFSCAVGFENPETGEWVSAEARPKYIFPWTEFDKMALETKQ